MSLPIELPQIVAMGGGGWGMEPDNPLLDNYVFALAGVEKPRVCFLPTASGDNLEYIVRFYDCMSRRGDVVPCHLQLFERTQEPGKVLLNQDVIYVGGGNTANMLAVWRLHGVDRVLRKAWEKGIILTGVSAGMNCWFEACSTDSFGPLAPLYDGLGFLQGGACPHYNGEAARRPTLHELLRQGFPPTYAAEDGATLHFAGDTLHAVVSSRPTAKAFRLELRNGEVDESALETRYLGDVA